MMEESTCEEAVALDSVVDTVELTEETPKVEDGQRPAWLRKLKPKTKKEQPQTDEQKQAEPRQVSEEPSDLVIHQTETDGTIQQIVAPEEQKHDEKTPEPDNDDQRPSWLKKLKKKPKKGESQEMTPVAEASPQDTEPGTIQSLNIHLIIDFFITSLLISSVALFPDFLTSS